MNRPSPAAEWRSHICTACSLLCDDMRVRIEEQRVVAVEPPCPLASEVLASSQSPPAARCQLRGQPIEYAKAIDAAATILRQARLPLVTGLQQATVEAVRAAIAIADQLRALIDPIDEHGRSGNFAAVQSVGAVTATLGEIAARADVIVTWFADPATTHPRLRQRLGEQPRRGAASGADRCWIAIDSQSTATTAAADCTVPAHANAADDAAAVLSALLRGVQLDADRTESSTGISLNRWRELADQLASARYVALVYDEISLGGGQATARRSASVALAELAVAMHAHARCVTLPLAPRGNLVGARQALAWQTGFPGTVSFVAGAPAYRPDEADAETLVRRREADAVLLVGGDPLSDRSAWSPAARDAWRSIPTIVLDSAATASMQAADVAIATRRFELAETGAAFRTDGIALPLVAAVDSTAPATAQVLAELAERLADRN